MLSGWPTNHYSNHLESENSATQSEFRQTPRKPPEPLGKLQGLGRKGPRHRTTPEQFEILFREFLHNETPSAADRQWLSRRVGLSDRQVRIWFQNQRAKKRKSLKSGNGQLFDTPGDLPRAAHGFSDGISGSEGEFSSETLWENQEAAVEVFSETFEPLEQPENSGEPEIPFYSGETVNVFDPRDGFQDSNWMWGTESGEFGNGSGSSNGSGTASGSGSGSGETGSFDEFADLSDISVSPTSSLPRAMQLPETLPTASPTSYPFPGATPVRMTHTLPRHRHHHPRRETSESALRILPCNSVVAGRWHRTATAPHSGSQAALLVLVDTGLRLLEYIFSREAQHGGGGNPMLFRVSIPLATIKKVEYEDEAGGVMRILLSESPKFSVHFPLQESFRNSPGAAGLNVPTIPEFWRSSEDFSQEKTVSKAAWHFLHGVSPVAYRQFLEYVAQEARVAQVAQVVQ